MIEQTTDRDFIRSIVTHSSVWPHAVDEGHDPATWMPPMEGCLWLRCEGVAGVALVYRVSGLIYAYDVALLPQSRAPGVPYAQRRGYIDMLCDWLRRNTNCKHLVAFIAEDNTRSIAAAEADGLKLEGRIPQCKRRGDGFVDAYLYGIEV